MLVLDQHAIGGQAGASARIENYLDNPRSSSAKPSPVGRSIKHRSSARRSLFRWRPPAWTAAVPRRRRIGPCASNLRPALSSTLASSLSRRGSAIGGPTWRIRAMFEGAGVSYWASPVEAKLCEGEEVALVGAGNSAGQAVVYLASKVRRLHLDVRGTGLEASMSKITSSTEYSLCPTWNCTPTRR